MYFENNNSIVEKHYIVTKTDLQGIITYVSPAFCKITGYTQEELLGKPHSIVKHEDTNISIFKSMWRSITNNKSWTGIIKNKKKNGDAYWVDSYIESEFKDGEKIGYQSIRFDVTSEYKLVQTNNNLNSSIKKFGNLFDSIDSGVAVIDFNGNFLKVNSYLSDLLGYEKEELLKSSIFTKHSQTSEIKEIIENNKRDLYLLNYEEEKQCSTKTGKKIWIKAKYKYFYEDKIIITIQDISSQKDLEKASTLLLKQSKDADLGEMISMIAHQWRQPLATIESILSKIKAKRELKIYTGKDLTLDSSKISSLVLHLSKTIDFFREYSKPKKGNLKSFIEIFETIKNIIEPLCAKENIKLKLKIEDESILLDDRIEQVILNIFKNSLDAYVDRELAGNIDTKVYKKESIIFIEIKDYAGGIEKELINKVLDPYFSTKSKNGTGLGLYMCKNIVTDLLLGKFYFENHENGITFFIELEEKGER